MPRKRNKGQRASSPEKIIPIGSKFPNESLEPSKHLDNPWARDFSSFSSFVPNENSVFLELKEKFGKKIDNDTIYRVFKKCNFEAMETIACLNEILNEDSATGMKTPCGFSRLPLKSKSDGNECDNDIPFLSPKTPSTVMNPSSYFNVNQMNPDFNSAIAAFDSFANKTSDSAFVSKYSTDVSRYNNVMTLTTAKNSSGAQTRQTTTTRKKLFTNTQSDVVDELDKTNTPKSEKSKRKHNVSLDPQERETLEKLIEEVITLGSDQVISASESNSSDSESDIESDQAHHSQLSDKKEKGVALAKQYQSQMKVAMKHMKNLPPRFVRKLEVAKQFEPDDLEKPKDTIDFIESSPPHINSPSTVHKVKLHDKRRNKERLAGIDNFVDEERLHLPPQSSLLNSLPNSQRNSRSNSPHISNIEDANNAMIAAHNEHLRLTSFSISAPEFIPRTATPVSSLSTTLSGQVSQQPFSSGPATKRGKSTTSHAINNFARVSPVAGPIASRVSPYATTNFTPNPPLLTANQPTPTFPTSIHATPFIPTAPFPTTSFNGARPLDATTATSFALTAAAKLAYSKQITANNRFFYHDLIQPVLPIATPLSYERSANVAQGIVDLYKSQNLSLMIILRGCPGSGKTTLAQQIVGDNGIILSSDDYYQRGNRYEFDHNKLGEAHEWNQSRTKAAIIDKKNPIIVDNTNTMSWEMRSYIAMGMKYNYCIELMEPDTPWRFSVKELVLRNRHGVTRETIQKMVDRYEHGVNVQSIMGVKWLQNMVGKQCNANDAKKKREKVKSKQKSRGKENQPQSRPVDSGFHESSPVDLDDIENPMPNTMNSTLLNPSLLVLSNLENDVTDRLIDDVINDEVADITRFAPPIGSSKNIGKRSRKLNLSGFTDKELTMLAAHLKIVDKSDSIDNMFSENEDNIDSVDCGEDDQQNFNNNNNSENDKNAMCPENSNCNNSKSEDVILYLTDENINTLNLKYSTESIFDSKLLSNLEKTVPLNDDAAKLVYYCWLSSKKNDLNIDDNLIRKLLNESNGKKENEKLSVLMENGNNYSTTVDSLFEKFSDPLIQRNILESSNFKNNYIECLEKAKTEKKNGNIEISEYYLKLANEWSKKLLESNKKGKDRLFDIW